MQEEELFDRQSKNAQRRPMELLTTNRNENALPMSFSLSVCVYIGESVHCHGRRYRCPVRNRY